MWVFEVPCEVEEDLVCLWAHGSMQRLIEREIEREGDQISKKKIRGIFSFLRRKESEREREVYHLELILLGELVSIVWARVESTKTDCGGRERREEAREGEGWANPHERGKHFEGKKRKNERRKREEREKRKKKQKKQR